MKSLTVRGHIKKKSYSYLPGNIVQFLTRKMYVYDW